MSKIKQIVVSAPTMTVQAEVPPPPYSELVRTLCEAGQAFADEHEVDLDDVLMDIDYPDRRDRLTFHEGKVKIINRTNGMVPFVVIDEQANTHSSSGKLIVNGFFHHSQWMAAVAEEHTEIDDSLDLLLREAVDKPPKTDRDRQRFLSVLSYFLDRQSDVYDTVDYMPVEPEDVPSDLKSTSRIENTSNSFEIITDLDPSNPDLEESTLTSLSQVSKRIMEVTEMTNGSNDNLQAMTVLQYRTEDDLLFAHRHPLVFEEGNAHRVVLGIMLPFVLIEGYKASPDLMGWSRPNVEPGIYVNSSDLMNFADICEDLGYEECAFLATEVRRSMEDHGDDFLDHLDIEVRNRLFAHVDAHREYTKELIDEGFSPSIPEWLV